MREFAGVSVTGRSVEVGDGEKIYIYITRAQNGQRKSSLFDRKAQRDFI